MRLRTITLIIGLLICGHARGQLILTEEENLSWMNKLKQENELGAQLNILRTRILADTNVYVKPIGDRGFLKTEKHKNKKDGICRPILLVEGNLIQITNDTDILTVKGLTKELTTKNIKAIEILDGEKAKALFGQSGWCGVVMMTTTKKKAKKTLLRYKS